MEKIILYAGIIFVVIVAIGAVLMLTQNKTTNQPISQSSELDEFASNIVSGGPPKDGIPPIDNPVYVSSAEADKFLADDDIVFGLNYKGTVKAFPQKILVWHEIVNDVIEGEQVSFTYCPLTGSAVGFKGKYNSTETTFGTSGKLVNSNLVMYDRATDSYWPQILGAAVTGPNKGTKLEKVQLIWTSWGKWKQAFPDTLVLSQNTGFLRNYNSDPYGDYKVSSSYYNSGPNIFPVLRKDNRLPDKAVVIGIEIDSFPLAIEKEFLKREKVINAEVGGEKIAAFYDSGLDAARVYSRDLEGRLLEFRVSDNKIIDNEGTEWDINGNSVKGRLEPTVYFDAMWFSWYAFFPDTESLKL